MFSPLLASDEDKEVYFSRLILNSFSLSKDAQEARQNRRFWNDTLGVADKNMNDVHGVLQVLSALPELKIKE